MPTSRATAAALEQKTCAVAGQPKLWAETHHPGTEADLVIAKKRIAEVKEIIFAGTRRLVFLRGPPGSGKASVLKSVCTDLGLEVVEWSEAAGARKQKQAGTTPPESISDAFVRFIAEAGRYSNLHNVATASGPGRPRRRVALVREFPTTLVDFQGGGDRHQRAQQFVERFQATVNGGAVQRLVMCFGDTREDYKVVQRLSSSIDPGLVATVNFDGVAKTFVKKALDEILKAQGIAAKEVDTGTIAVECNGDLRHGINALQLAAGGLRPKPPGPAPRGRGRAATPTPQGTATARLDMAGGGSTSSTAPANGAPAVQGIRAASLGLFHGLGRLMYCKRIPPTIIDLSDTAGPDATQGVAASQPAAKKRRRAGSAADVTAQPEPKQLPYEQLVPKSSRPPLYFVPEEVMAASNADPEWLVDWVFTNAPRFFGDVDDLANFAETLAAADAWDTSRDFYKGGMGEAPQAPWDTLAASVQVRSMLDANLHPKKPTFQDPSLEGAGQEETTSFNMVRPLLRDIERHRLRRADQVRSNVEVMGRSICATGSTLHVRTLPHMDLMMKNTKGQHFRQSGFKHGDWGLPLGLLQVMKELGAFDGKVLRRDGEGKDRNGDDASAQNQSAGGGDGPQDLNAWATQLEDDPIEAAD
eukprot:TRINITY_DN32481_c0_g1_i1.p1 TRINITY_DN32481_c0_g1~~TRINITY_DN32481_c0_g1_i1.p1  ORF type:complete len:643 (+),score=138.75 TRINITY_DN32481_c0_g1_i1:127-2055(+)